MNFTQSLRYNFQAYLDSQAHFINIYVKSEKSLTQKVFPIHFALRGTECINLFSIMNDIFRIAQMNKAL